MLTGNKGEWSEIYTFLKLLSDGKLHAADSDLNKIEDIYYPLIKILRNESSENLEYEYGQMIRVVDSSTKEELLGIPVREFKEKSLQLFNEIKKAKGRSFSIPEIEKFMNSIKCYKLKAGSSDKSDIRIMVHDIHTGLMPILGFSIKSRLGGASTLLNAGKTTNFIYKVSGKVFSEQEIQEINAIETRSKIRDRLKAIENSGATLRYSGLNSEMFKLNLQVIDTYLPEMLSELLLYFYRGQASALLELLNLLTKDNPFHYNIEYEHDFYEYKLKSFIRDVALGMMPSKRWDGTFDATGGYIVVKEDGDILCYHLYNHNEFQSYLIKNTKLETASSSRYDFGYIYEDAGQQFFNLNLQIRFF